MGTGSPDWSGAKGQVEKSMFDRSTGPFPNGHGDFDRSICNRLMPGPGCGDRRMLLLWDLSR